MDAHKHNNGENDGAILAMVERTSLVNQMRYHFSNQNYLLWVRDIFIKLSFALFHSQNDSGYLKSHLDMRNYTTKP
jgi:hypothetical protein